MKNLLYPPYECSYGGYYGLFIVTPCPQTFHRSHDNLKNPYRSIAGKQDGPGPIIYGPPRAPPNSQKCKIFYIVAHI